MAPPSSARVAVVIVVSVAAVSTAATLIRLARAPALVVAFWRLAFATLILAPAAALVPKARREIAGLGLRDAAALALVGAVLALHFAAWIRSLDLTSVAASVVLVTMHPVLVGVASAWLLDEGLDGKAWVGVALGLSGTAVIAWGDAGLAGHRLVGDALALVGAGAMAAYLLAGRRYRRELGLLSYVVPVYASASVVLLASTLVHGDALSGWPATDYAIFLALAVVPMILGHTLLNWALGHVPAPVVATAILGEPVGAALIALAVLGEVPPVAVVVGGAVVLAGIGLVVRADRHGSPISAS